MDWGDSVEAGCVMAAILDKARAFFAVNWLPGKAAVSFNKSSLVGAAALGWNEVDTSISSLPEELVKDEADRQEISRQCVILSNSIFASVGC